jgi:hypothetical protein
MKNLLVSNKEIYFNKKDLLDLINASNGSNVIVVSTKKYAVEDDVKISYQAEAIHYNTQTGEKKKEVKRGAVVGAAPMACPYPPGCTGGGGAQKAAVMGTALNLNSVEVGNLS